MSGPTFKIFKVIDLNKDMDLLWLSLTSLFIELKFDTNNTVVPIYRSLL